MGADALDDRDVLSRRIREALLTRLDRLSPGCRRLLAAASILGREFDLEVVRRVAAAATGRMPSLLREAATADLVVGVPESPGRARFRHDLIRDALVRAEPAARRGRLHRRAGEVLEQLHGADGPHVGELALHFAAAVPAVPRKVVRYATAAGERAMAALAYEEARRLFRVARDALDRVDTQAGLIELQARLDAALARAHRLSQS